MAKKKKKIDFGEGSELYDLAESEHFDTPEYEQYGIQIEVKNIHKDFKKVNGNLFDHSTNEGLQISCDNRLWKFPEIIKDRIHSLKSITIRTAGLESIKERNFNEIIRFVSIKNDNEIYAPMIIENSLDIYQTDRTSVQLNIIDKFQKESDKYDINFTIYPETTMYFILNFKHLLKTK